LFLPRLALGTYLLLLAYEMAPYFALSADRSEHRIQLAKSAKRKTNLQLMGVPRSDPIKLCVVSTAPDFEKGTTH
jgi:hypothetical protein